MNRLRARPFVKCSLLRRAGSSVRMSSLAYDKSVHQLAQSADVPEQRGRGTNHTLSMRHSTNSYINDDAYCKKSIISENSR